jgi:ABC-type nitrate/sulfonate/bicarbonate transport system substrate-binding protein
MTHRLARRPRARHLLAFAAALALAAGGSLVAVATSRAKSSSCATVNTIRTGEAPALAYAPPQLAQTQGYMLKYCLQLQESPVSGASVLLAELEAGQADVGLLNPAGIIQAVESGIQLKVIAPNTGPGDFAVCVSKSSPITKLSQLAGKTVATSLLGSNTDIAFRVRLARAGVNINSGNVKFVQILTASLIPDIVNGVVDAGQCNEPGLTENLSGLRIIDQDPMEEVFGKSTPVTYAITTASFAAAHPTIVRDYQKAYLAMAAAVAKNPRIFRGAAVSFDGTPANVAQKMRLPALPTTYAFSQLWTQVLTLQHYGAIKQPISQSTLKALFVPLPKVGK